MQCDKWDAIWEDRIVIELSCMACVKVEGLNFPWWQSIGESFWWQQSTDIHSAPVFCVTTLTERFVCEKGNKKKPEKGAKPFFLHYSYCLISGDGGGWGWLFNIFQQALLTHNNVYNKKDISNIIYVGQKKAKSSVFFYEKLL